MNERVLIVGMGSIGRRHLECLREIAPAADITIWRQHHRDSEVPKGADRVVFDLESALACKPECAIVSNPATMHIDTAHSLAEAGVHLLIEKPLSHSLNDVDALIRTAERQGLILMVAYVLRFNEGLQMFRQVIEAGDIGRILSFRAEVGQYLPDWRPGSDYRQCVSARKELGGGALLELSHELDYVRWIFGEADSVSAFMTNTGALEIDTEDLVEIILSMRSPQGEAVTGSVHMDMLQRTPYRICRAVGTTGTLEWNPIDGLVRRYDSNTGEWRELHRAGPTHRNALYIRQLESFLAAVNGEASPMISGDDGKAVLEMACAARESSETGRRVVLA